MKKLKYILSAVLVSLLAFACTNEPEEFILKEAVSPQLREHAAILVTNSTMNEAVTFTWSAARVPGGSPISYNLYGKYSNGALSTFGTTTDLALCMSKSEFNSKILAAGFPESANDQMDFVVKAYYDDKVLESEVISVNIVSQGDLLPAVIELESQDLVLDSKTWDSKVVISWADARLENGAAINYKLFGAFDLEEGTKADPENGAFLIAETDKSQVEFTQEQFNDIIVKAGAQENAKCNVSLYVVASSEEYPDGIQSAKATMNVTTYSVTYPEQIYVPGSHQDWSPATAPVIKMTNVKGIYESFVQLIDAKGGDECEFKFSPNPEWKDDFGGTVTVDNDPAKATITASGTLEGGSNIKVPNGLYRVELNYKTKELNMVKVETLGLIGAATAEGWGAQTNLTYDAKENVWSTVTNMTEGEFKIRLNDDWSWAIGANGIFGGDEPNYSFTKEAGEYKVILNTSVAPYTIKFLSTTYPEKLYIPGSHQGWSPATAQWLQNNGEGLYEGYINLSDAKGGDVCEFKFSPKPEWSGDFGGAISYEADAESAEGTLGGSDNIKVPNGYYKINVDMPNQTFTLTLVKTISLIGEFNGWGDDLQLEFDAEKNVWVKTGFEAEEGKSFKLRLNNAWSMNFGAAVSEEPYVLKSSVIVAHNGKNMTVAATGTYTLTLDVKTTPYTLSIE